jgi:ElaB/YqjD/DUF883 family membrane-anchored ribosome-binding protein
MKPKKTQDLPDNPKDKKKLEPEETTLDLPGVSDIPGQEHVRVPSLGELADTTASSDDEEGKGILDDEQDENFEETSDVSKEERQALRDAANKVVSEDQAALDTATPDQFDEDGELLNERTKAGGGDLDVPGAELDDDNEAIGEEDEENNSYSLPGEDEDQMNERQ